MPTSWRSSALVAVFLLALGSLARLLPHPPNFAPIAAIALFAGFFFRSRLLAAVFPLLALLASDFFLGTYDLRIAFTVYLSLLLPLFLGPYLRSAFQDRRFAHASLLLGSSSLLASLLFFLSTNTAVWLWGGLYPASTDGLLLCFSLALPFFHYTLAGDLFFSTLLFGSYALAFFFVEGFALHTPHKKRVAP